jgi:hypothetical protein
VVLVAPADTLELHQRLDRMGSQLVRRADAGAQEELRRVEYAGREDDAGRTERGSPAIVILDLHPTGAIAVE